MLASILTILTLTRAHKCTYSRMRENANFKCNRPSCSIVVLFLEQESQYKDRNDLVISRIRDIRSRAFFALTTSKWRK